MRGRCGPRRAGFVGVYINPEKIVSEPVQGLMGAEIPALGFAHRAWVLTIQLGHLRTTKQAVELKRRAACSGRCVGLAGPAAHRTTRFESRARNDNRL